MPLDAPAPAPTQFESPLAYTPKHLADKILASQSALVDERKQVTVLFADVKGSLELLADQDPEQARRLMDPVIELMMEAVHRYEGTVSLAMGDGIVALFGAPLAHEDHAVRACYAALDMQRAIGQYAHEVRRTQGVAVQIRVGLNSGEVVVRALESDLHMDYSAIGQTTWLAARMEQLATPGGILLTPDTLRLVEGFVEVRPLGATAVKGLEAPIEVYEVAGPGPRRSRLQAAAARGLTRFVGRDAELEQVRGALERAAAGRGQVAAIVGEPGVGKSRLIWEVTHSYRTHGWLILESSAVPYGKATTYLPLIDLLKGYFQIAAHDDDRTVREKLTGKLLTLDESLKPALPAFLDLIGVPSGDPQWQALDATQRRQRTLDAVKHLLLRESRDQPLLLVFEDLHWIDPETQALLDSLVESLPATRILLLVNYRPEYQHGWGNKGYYTQLRLDPLPPASAEELLDALLGVDPGLAAVKQFLIERTDGNPFFLEESVQALAETGDLAGQPGAYHLPGRFRGGRVPATVQAVLAARIDRLPLEEKGLLQTAAVIGKDVPFALLEELAQLPDEALRGGLAHLQAAEFLYETSLFPEVEYTFKHALTYEVAYGGLLQDRRRALHARAVEALESLYPDRRTEHTEQLAHHAFRGEVWKKAVPYLREAGAKAAGRSAHREAVVWYEQALGALEHLPGSPDGDKHGIDIRLSLRNSLFSLGDYRQIFGHLSEAQALAKRLNDRARLAAVRQALANYFWVSGRPEQALISGQQGLAIVEPLGDAMLMVRANQILGLTCWSMGDYRQGAKLTALAGTLAESLPDDGVDYARGAFSPIITCRTWAACCLSELGDFDAAIAAAEEGLRIATTLEQPLPPVAAAFGFGLAHLRRGDVAGAIPVLEGALEVSRAAGLQPTDYYGAASILGAAYALSGRVAEAVALLAPLAEQALSMGIVLHSLLIAISLGEAYLAGGRTKDATDLGERTLHLAQDHGQRGIGAWALRLLGESAAVPHEAEAHYLKALALAEELGMRPLQAHCHLGLSRLDRQSAGALPAREHLSTATSMYREMGMQFWLDKMAVGDC